MKYFCNCFAAALLVSAHAAAADSGYRVAERFALGGNGGWDIPSVDAQANRLYLSRSDHVQIVDTTSGKAVATIADTPGVHGIALAPELGRGYISCGKANAVKVFDLKTDQVLATIATGENPDMILFEPVTQRVFAFNGRGASASVIDTKTNQVVATIALDGKPEFAQADGKGLVFVNIEDKAQLVVLDAHTSTLKSRFVLPQCEEPTGLALDTRHRRSFSACGNKNLAVLDMDSGKSVASLPIGEGSDGAEFDAANRTIFSSNGEGSLSVIRQIDANHYQALAPVATQRGARTLVLNPTDRKLYLPAAEYEKKSASDDAHARPHILDNSFVVLVVDSSAPRKSGQR